MAYRNDWSFDVVDHVLDHYAEALQFTPDEQQRYTDRVTGTVYEALTHQDRRAVILLRGVGFINAERYRRWVALPKGHWESITSRPPDWRFFVLMIGLLPDGQPWWSAIYEESTLAELRDHSENMRGWYRWDPGLTEKALIKGWDKDAPEGMTYTLTDAHETITTQNPTEFLEALTATAVLASEGPDHGIVKITPHQITIDFDSVLAADISAGAASR